MRSAGAIVLRNSIFVLGSRLIVKFISFAFVIWIARTLGDVGFGRYALIWSYVAVFAAFSDLGMATYLIREAARNHPHNRYLVSNVIVLRLILAIFTILLIGITSWEIGYSTEIVYQFCLASTILLLYAVQDPLDSVIQAKERADLSSILRIAGQLAFVVLGAIFLFYKKDVTGLIFATLANIFIVGLLSWHLIQRYLGGMGWQVQPNLWPKLLVASLPFGIIGFAVNWSQKIDTVILSLYWPENVIGWYNAAYGLVLGMVIISNSFNLALYPTMSKQSAENYLTLNSIYQPIFKYLLIISLPLAIIISSLSGPIILTLYGQMYAPAVLPLAILAWVLPFTFISEFLRYTALTLDREKQAAQSVIITSLGNIVFNFIFIPRYGMGAAAVITVLTEVTLVTLYGWQLRSAIKIQMIWAAVWKPLLAAFSLLAVFQLTRYIPWPLLVIPGTLTYLGMIILLGALETHEISSLYRLISRILPTGFHSL